MNLAAARAGRNSDLKSVVDSLMKPEPMTILLGIVVCAGAGWILLARPATLLPTTQVIPAPSKRVKWYDYDHKETTGITEFLIVDGKEIPIQYTKDSAPAALQACYEAPPEYDPEYNPDQGSIVRLVGELLPIVKMTPKCDGCAEPEPYQDFRLLYTDVTPWTPNLSKRQGAFRYEHFETTALTDSLFVNGRWVQIKFTEKSDTQSLKTLRKQLEIEYAETKEHVDGQPAERFPLSVHLVGELFPETRMTPQCDDCAEPEPYQEFRLDFCRLSEWTPVPYPGTGR